MSTNLQIEYFKITRRLGTTTRRIAVVIQDDDGTYALSTSRNGKPVGRILEFNTLDEAETAVSEFFA